MPGPIIAIDGPSGSGKSSTSRGVAQRLGLRYIDTGAMYRAMTWWMLANGIDADDPVDIAARCREPVIELRDDPADPGVSVDGRDVSLDIREGPVADAVSRVAAVPQVRERLVVSQRSMVEDAVAAGSGVVMEGRDIGTVVLPGADLKIYLTADVEARAARRALEESERSGKGSVTSVQANLQSRDALDTTRTVSPLQQAADAIAIDGTHLSLDEVIDAVIRALPPDAQ
ncbi:MAG: (d)CMP kinase [Candidatus Nanopelagicales bacterium]